MARRTVCSEIRVVTTLSEEYLDIELLEDAEKSEAGGEVIKNPAMPEVRDDDLEKESLIVKYGTIEYRRRRIAMNKQDEPEEVLNEDQKKYVTLLSEGHSNQDACERLNIDRIVPTIWAKMRGNDSIYGICINAIKEMQADDLEDEVWKQAIENPKSTELKKFALKARKEEYKDNVQQPVNVQTNIRVTLDGTPYRVQQEDGDVSYA